MAPKPYLREADDGTFELLVPAGFDRVHVLPYCFHTEEDAARWLTSRKGKERLMNLGGQIDQVAVRQSFRSIEQSLT
ncbi:hypothetical protein KKP04_13245 [Rhodomicrobium sp. Az07]|uniref:hypothetical protein n=1 Tax=Rhodomicrobium sp. Az07 TaxID=2839034 RepID=UPI001BE77DF0|nr:hypothetical protein [Rhodomicrobium sp. Az07]MBT3071832.1 hypothetical protein [Rhodomicrobium sp. Az07]